jgi:hypothetical protein
MGLGDHWDRFELEAVEGFPRRQPCFEQMPLDTASIASSDLVFGQGCEEAR